MNDKWENVYCESLTDVPEIGETVYLNGRDQCILERGLPRFRFTTAGGTKAIYTLLCRTNYGTLVLYIFKMRVQDY